MMNKLETVTLDLSPCWDNIACRDLRTAQYLLKASSQPRKLFVRCPGLLFADSAMERYILNNRTEVINWVNEGLKLPGRLERVSTSAVDELWFWERGDGEKLDVKAWNY